MKIIELILITAAVFFSLKIKALIEAGLAHVTCKLEYEKRRLEIVTSIDQILKDQDELSMNYKLYEDLGDKKKCIEIQKQYAENQCKYITLKNRM